MFLKTDCGEIDVIASSEKLTWNVLLNFAARAVKTESPSEDTEKKKWNSFRH